MTFDSNQASKPAKNFNDLTTEYFPFWKPLFEHLKISNPVFKSKLCYNSNEFKKSPEEDRIPAVRFFKSELASGQDLYIELCDWDYNFYNPMFRTLYRLKYDPEWATKSDKYVQSNNTKHTTFAVKLSDFELVNETHITKSIPELHPESTKSTDEFEDAITKEEEALSDLYGDQDDAHISTMTIRDKYCITHNVPMTNKKWLNDLIKKGIEWQKKNQK